MNAITTTAIVLSLALAAGGAMAATPKGEPVAGVLTNNTTTGENSGCLDYLILFAIQGEHSPIGDDERIDSLNPETEWEATSGDGTVWIDFYDSDGEWLEGSGPDSGLVPEDAAYAYGCVVESGEWPDVPVPGATFTYEDDLDEDK